MSKTLRILIFILIAIVPILSGQEGSVVENSGLTIDLDNMENDPRRIEIQRYIGYETLLARYLTLPYDICVNTSNQGRYFDIGYALLLILPISLLLLFYKNKKTFYPVLLSLMVYMGICKYYSFQNMPGVGSLNRNADNWNNITGSLSLSFLDQVLLYLNELFVLIAKPAILLIEYVSGSEDSTTYFTILLILMGGIALLSRTSTNRPLLIKFFLTSIFIFIMLWIIFSGGIIWYGFLAIPLLFMSSLKEFKKESLKKIKYIAFIGLIPWILMSFISRVSNIEVYQPKDNWGKNIMHNSLVPYSTGFQDAQTTKNNVYNNISQALSTLNSTDALVYQVGTSLSYEIKSSTERVISDNTLNIFFWLLKVTGAPKEIGPAFKASGIEYVILDLYTPTLDKTPEKSLTDKYKLFVASLYESSNVKLLSTDRVLNLRNEDGQVAQLSHIFAKGYGDKVDISIANHGTYAIFQIL